MEKNHGRDLIQLLSRPHLNHPWVVCKGDTYHKWYVCSCALVGHSHQHIKILRATWQFGPLLQMDQMVSLTQMKWIWWWEKPLNLVTFASHWRLRLMWACWPKSQEWSLGTQGLDTVGWETVFQGMYLLEDGGFQQTTFQLHGVACQKHQSAPCRLASGTVLHGLYQMWPYLSGGFW